MERGVRLGNETFDSIPATARIRPLRDVIIVEPLNWEPSKIIAVAYSGKPLRGTVRAVGPGKWLTQYASGNPPVWAPTHSPPAKGKRTAMRDSKIFRPCVVKPGELVELGGLELHGYLFMTVRWGSTEMVVCREEDVTLVDDGAIVCEQADTYDPVFAQKGAGRVGYTLPHQYSQKQCPPTTTHEA